MEIEAKIQLGPLEIDGIKKKLEDIIDKMRDSVSLWEDDPYTQHDIKEKNFVYTAPWMKKGEYLRIRDEDGDGSDGYSKKVFTYKGKNKIVNGLNCREEVNAEWEDDDFKEPYESLKELFEALGFKLYAKYDKKRENTEFQDGVTVSFDKIMQLPIATRNFVEIEGPTEKQVFSMLEQLGLEDRTVIHESYADLIRKEKN